MRVFVTGASGFIGSYIVRALMKCGHQVIGLARSDASAQIISRMGAEVCRGDVQDLKSLKGGVMRADSVIHVAFMHDMSRFKETCEIDRRAIETLGSALEGSARRIVVASGMTADPMGKTRIETDKAIPSAAFPRAASEEAFESVVKLGVSASLIRLPTMVHDQTKFGIADALIQVAKKNGFSAFVESGENCWPAVHVSDAADLFRLALEKGKAGYRYHAIGEEGLSSKDIAEAIGRRLSIPVKSISSGEAAQHFGWLNRLAVSDLASSSAITRQQLGWIPSGSGFFTDIENS